MKVDPILIEGCKRQDPRSQKALYSQLSDHMFAVCLRYLKKREEAEDVLLESFYKVFTQMDKYSGKGSFEGWIRKIIVNECLMKLRKNRLYFAEINEDIMDNPSEYKSGLDQLLVDDILILLNDLPMGYRTVFNLYVIEGFKHKEIAERLGISINTSKSQLILARKKLICKLKEINHPGIG